MSVQSVISAVFTSVCGISACEIICLYFSIICKNRIFACISQDFLSRRIVDCKLPIILTIRRFQWEHLKKQQFLLSASAQVMKKREKKQLNRLNLTCIMHFRNIRYTAHGQVPVSAPNSRSGTGSTLWILMRQ